MPPGAGAGWIALRAGELPAAPGPGEVQVFLASLDNPPWPGETLRAALEPAELARAERFHFERHRRHFIHARGLLRHLLARALGSDPHALRFAFGPQGKPGLEAPEQTGPRTLDFNLSHSGGLGVVALSDGASVGVDIEAPRAVPELLAIARQNFAAGELATLQALPAGQQPDAFLACWTRKEAFVKALGGGLSVALDSFEVSLDPRQPAQLLSSADPRHPREEFTLGANRTPEGAWTAVVVRRARASLRTFSLL
ncbi:MAG: 4'-phosphopantetheinyl transferase superfamily protein [Rubrivivax sp.]|nr:4'-phosphopantetheinyl transferase superfamily protein [Rubrivivax sp.]